MRFSLVDRITSLTAGESITAIKTLSLAEEYLADHFPGFPVEPGVLMLESMVQAGAWLVRHTEGFRYSVVMLKQARALKFNSFLTPGHTLCVTCKVQKCQENEYVLKASGVVDEKSTVSARLTLEQFNLADREAGMAGIDERLISSMRQQFGQLWSPAETA